MVLFNFTSHYYYFFIFITFLSKSPLGFLVLLEPSKGGVSELLLLRKCLKTSFNVLLLILIDVYVVIY
ncbi:hypothetical protein L2E82_08348 [Cichorium intybus]|uniref:Uncharacterized protein n=1 Tax=Cichorium intybus TaxID=13427 RepID=A0ACB9G685_CICIN|nr:hypothetical protein L2E82_08348 [Cichorium intybus]